MTVTEIRPSLTHVTAKGRKLYINGDFAYSFDRPVQFTFDELYDDVVRYCNYYDVHMVSTENLKRVVRELILAVYKDKPVYVQPAIEKTNTKQLYFDTAQALMVLYAFRAYNDSGEILVYDTTTGCYRPEQGTIRAHLERTLEKENLRRAEKEIRYHILCAKGIDRADVCGLIHGNKMLHVADGWLDIFTGEVQPHTPEIVSLAALGIRYDPAADCPMIRRFFAQVLDPRDIFPMYQKIGYILLSDNRFEKVFIFMGKGANGKSVTLDLLAAFAGADNVSFESLHDLLESEYARAHIADAVLNIDHDLEELEMTQSSALKKLTSGNPMTMRQIYGKPFNAKPRAKLFIATNAPPKFDTEGGYAVRRRLDLTMFGRSIPPDEQDPCLVEKLTTQEELSGLLTLALHGLRYLLKHGWAKRKSVLEVQREYDAFTDNVTKFLKEKCKIESTAKTPTVDVYMAYMVYCREQGVSPLDNVVFGGELAARSIEKTSTRINGMQAKVYRGLRLL